MTYNPCNQVML